MQTNYTTQADPPKTENFMMNAYIYTVYVYMLCTRHLVVQCRLQSYSKYWNNIYSVSVVNSFVSVLFSFLGRLFDRVDLIKPVSNVCLSVRFYVRAYVRPSVHKKFLWFQWNLACSWKSMSDARWYAVWPNPRSRSRALQSWKSGHFQKLSPLPFTVGAGNGPRILKLRHII